MIKYPKISIVTPSFNQGQYIEQTILSIINQGYPNLEYIIIDGGSTDNTVDIIKKYQRHISYWVSEPDRGQSDALNKGLAKCTGDIFNWINSDDYLEPNALFAVAKSFDEDVDIVCGYSRLFFDEGNATIMEHRTELFPLLEQTIVEQRINQQGMFYKLAIARKLGGINTELHYVMDLELWWRYLSCYGQERIKQIPNLLAHFRIHNMSKTGACDKKFRQEEASIWNHLLKQLRIGKVWADYFETAVIYKCGTWKFSAIKVNELKSQLANKYLYAAYLVNDKKFSRRAFWQLAKTRRLRLSFQSLAMFVKLFVGDFSFRKYLKYNA
jgi:glycosyltransferase involved in cell wall biosynthesis